MTSDPSLSPMQARVLAVVQGWVDRHGFPPTVREIGAAVGLRSPSSVAHHLRSLERRGLIRRAGGARALSTERPAETPAGDVRIPVLGAIAAGLPVLADQQVEDEITMPVSMVGQGRLFALRVCGDSMIDAAICDGDVVVVLQQPTADSGDIVAAMIDGEATVKRFRRRDKHVELVPENERYAVIPADDAVILGKVTCVVRRI